MSDLSEAAFAADQHINAVHAAFGSPGDYGYESGQGAALYALYRTQVELRAAYRQALVQQARAQVKVEPKSEQQLVARIKRGSKYWGQTEPNQWFDVRVVEDNYYQLRGNSNNYRLSDVVCGIRLESGAIVDFGKGTVGVEGPREVRP